MNGQPIEPWIVDVFHAVDNLDAATWAKAFTEDGSMRFGNSDVVRGRDQLEAALAGFYTVIGGLSHEILGVWSGQWEHGDVRSVESNVTYTRKDGSRTPPIPVTTTIRRRGDLIADWRIFMDISPLFAPEG